MPLRILTRWLLTAAITWAVLIGACALAMSCELEPVDFPDLAPSCDHDYQCDPGEVCERGGCWVPCVEHADCDGGVCAGFVGGDDYDVKVCRAVAREE